MILESIVTTADSSGVVNVAPMGPEVDGPAVRQIKLKPFRTSRTFSNLRSVGTAVVHVTDDVELIAATAIGRIEAAAGGGDAGLGFDQGMVGHLGRTEPLLDRWHKLVDCCHWYAVEVEAWTEDDLRPVATCRIVHHGFQRPMFGPNRGKHAVIEAAILVTRLGLIGRDEVRARMGELRPLVEKTGGAAEHRAWLRLESAVDG